MSNNNSYDIYAKISILGECIKDCIDNIKGDYDNLEDCIQAIQDNGRFHEEIDGNVDIYNYDLLAWVSSDLKHSGYIEEAIEEGLCNTSKNVNFFNMIMCGQYKWLEEHAHEYLRELQEDSKYQDYRQSFEKQEVM